MRRLGALLRGLPADAAVRIVSLTVPVSPKPKMASTSDMRRFFGKAASYVG